MPDKPSAGPGGLLSFFVDKGDGPQEITMEEAATLGQPQAQFGLLLSLVGRVADLEALARAARIGELEAKEKVTILVLGDQEAQAEISRLSLALATCERDLERSQSGETVDEGTIAELQSSVATLETENSQLTIQLETSTAQVASMFITIGAVGAQLIQLGNFQVETSADIQIIQTGVLAQAAALAAV